MIDSERIAERASTSRKLMVSFVVEPNGTPRVASCEVLGDSYRNRTSWYRPCLLHEVMQPRIAETIRECLSKLSGTSGVISLPSLLHEQPGLLLSHAHVIASKDATGKLSVILRFKTFIGSLSEVFEPHVDSVNGVPDTMFDLADRIMMDISIPLLNFLSLDEVGGVLGKEDAERVVAQLTEQSHALRFQIELIKRHVARLEAARRVPTARTRISNNNDLRPTSEIHADFMHQHAPQIMALEANDDFVQERDEDIAYVESRPSNG